VGEDTLGKSFTENFGSGGGRKARSPAEAAGMEREKRERDEEEKGRLNMYSK
jgi:hypothetical protein